MCKSCLERIAAYYGQRPVDSEIVSEMAHGMLDGAAARIAVDELSAAHACAAACVVICQMLRFFDQHPDEPLPIIRRLDDSNVLDRDDDEYAIDDEPDDSARDNDGGAGSLVN